MKRITLLFLLTALAGLAEEVTLAKPTLLKGDRAAVSLKAGTLVEVLARNGSMLTVRHNKTTGTIPAGNVVATAPAEAPKNEESKKAEAKPTPPRKAETTYGKAVEKARENAGKHDKNVVKPTDEILEK